MGALPKIPRRATDSEAKEQERARQLYLQQRYMREQEHAASRTTQGIVDGNQDLSVVAAQGDDVGRPYETVEGLPLVQNLTRQGISGSIKNTR